jgi:transcriptional regulator with XRE-family HTH domain
MELKIARRIARLSQQELARRAGFDVNVIIQIEGGDRDILYELRTGSVAHLAQVLGVTPTVLFPVPPLPRAPDAERSTGAADRTRGSRRCLKHLSAPSIRFPIDLTDDATKDAIERARPANHSAARSSRRSSGSSTRSITSSPRPARSMSSC